MFLRAISLFALATLASNPILYAVDLVLLDNTATGTAAIANVASRALISTVSQSAVTFTNQNAVAAELTSITFPVEPFQAVNDVTIKVELWTVQSGEPGAVVPGMSKSAKFSFPAGSKSYVTLPISGFIVPAGESRAIVIDSNDATNNLMWQSLLNDPAPGSASGFAYGASYSTANIDTPWFRPYGASNLGIYLQGSLVPVPEPAAWAMGLMAMGVLVTHARMPQRSGIASKR